MAFTPNNPAAESQLRRYYQKITPILKKPKMREYTTAVFSFLAISLFVLYAIRPTAQTIIFLRREIADKITLNEQMENKITALIEAQATYETVKDRLAVVDEALPKNPDAVILARQLRNLALVFGASVSAIQIPSLPILGHEATPGAKLAATKPLENFPVSIVVSGTYPSLRSFLDGLLTLRRITSIDIITIKPAARQGFAGDTLQLSIRLQSYYSTQ